MRIFSYFHVGYTTSAITASFCKSNDRASQTAKGQSVSGPFKGRHVLNTTGSIIGTRNKKYETLTWSTASDVSWVPQRHLRTWPSTDWSPPCGKNLHPLLTFLATRELHRFSNRYAPNQLAEPGRQLDRHRHRAWESPDVVGESHTRVSFKNTTQKIIAAHLPGNQWP